MVYTVWDMLEGDGITVVNRERLDRYMSMDDVECVQFMKDRIKRYFGDIPVYLLCDDECDVVVDICNDEWCEGDPRNMYVTFISDEVCEEFPCNKVLLMTGYLSFLRKFRGDCL